MKSTTNPTRRLPRRFFRTIGQIVLASVTLLAATFSSPARAADPAGSINGRVLDSGSGRYLEGAEISLQGTGRRTTSAREGTFSFANVAPGSYTLEVAYPGLDEKSEAVTVASGQSTAAVVRLSSGDVITLGEFRVQGSKEGMAQAVALQKLSIQSKLVAAADQFGPISEGNVGEYLKYLPGLSIDYNANDARGVSLRGLNTSFTVVAVDGTPMAASSSTADTRRFEFEQIAMNNVETTELFKTVTPDIPASSTGGFVNFVTKSAFDREDESVLSYDFNLVVPSTNFSLTKESGVWGNDDEFVIRPNLDLNYARRIGEKIGININYRFSERYDDSPRTEINWLQSAGAAPTFYSTPTIEQYNIRTEQKITHREAFATKLDYHISDSTRLTVAGQWNWYDLYFHQRGPLFVLGGASTASGDAANPSYSAATGAAVRNDVLFRNKYGTTWHFNSTLSHDFGAAGKAWITGYWSHADGQYRDIQKGFISATAQLTNINGVRLDNAKTNEIPSVSIFNGGAAVDLDYMRRLENYSMTAAANNANYQSRPWTTNELKTGVSGNYRVDLPIEVVPTAVQVGFAVDTTERDITRTVVRAPLPGFTATGAELATLRDEGFTKDLAFGFGPYQVMDPYKMKDAYVDRLGTISEDFYREFTEDNLAAYVRFDVKPFADLLLIGGFRWEEREIDGFSMNRAIATQLPARTNLKYDKVYPSISFKYTPSQMKALVLRGGYSSTVGHPDYADLIAVVQLESTTGARDGILTQISPGIQPYFTQNWDFGVEYYLANSGVLSLSLFKKDVENFIVRRGMTQDEINAASAAAGVSPSNFTSGAVQYNGPDSSVEGYEIGYAQALSFLPKPFNGFNFQANFTSTDIDGDNNDVLWAQQRGAASKTFNFVLGYRIGKFSITTSTNWTDETVASGLVNTEWIRGTANNANTALDTQLVSIKADTTRTDIKVEYAFSSRYKVYAAVQNIFGEGRDDFWQGYLPEHSDFRLPRNHFQFGEPYYNVGIRGTF